MTATDASDWVTLTRLPAMSLAHVLKSRLEDEGIECLIQGEQSHQIYPGALSDVVVQVRAADLVPARRVMTEVVDVSDDGES